MNVEARVLYREAVAGVTTFLTMAYVIFVNPAILSGDGSGIPFSGALTATVLISGLATILMGVYARLPYALAPGQRHLFAEASKVGCEDGGGDSRRLDHDVRV